MVSRFDTRRSRSFAFDSAAPASFGMPTAAVPDRSARKSRPNRTTRHRAMVPPFVGPPPGAEGVRGIASVTRRYRDACRGSRVPDRRRMGRSGALRSGWGGPVERHPHAHDGATGLSGEDLELV